jgi:transcriptional regulator with XRE-family HTH domain
VLPIGYTGRVPKRRSDPPKNAIARMLWEFRLGMNLTQEAFAAKAKMARETIADWERGAANPDGDSLDRILKVFPEARRRLPVPVTGLSDSPATLAAAKMKLEAALDRRIDQLPKQTALLIQREIDRLAPRLADSPIDDASADVFVDLAARAIESAGGGTGG